MIRILAIFAITFGLGGGLGFLVAAANGVTLDGHDHGAHSHAPAPETGHEHTEFLDIPQTEAPLVALEVSADPDAGWNLHLTVEHFRFAPENVGMAHVAGEGHAHVYVNGEKVARLYGDWMHFSSLPPGAEVKVTLNSNDHRPLRTGGQSIAAVVMIDEVH